LPLSYIDSKVVVCGLAEICLQFKVDVNSVKDLCATLRVTVNNIQMMHGCKWNIQICCPEVDMSSRGHSPSDDISTVASVGVTCLSFAEIFSVRKQTPWAILWHCLHDPAFSRFSKTPTCDRQTHDDTNTCAS